VSVKARGRTLALVASLAALVAALVASALLAVERPDEAARARHERDGRVLEFRPADVVSVAIAPRGAPPVRLDRSPTGWRLSPGGAEASAPTVDGLLDRLAGMRVRDAVPATPDALAPRGLAPPASRVTLGLRSGGTIELDLGDENLFDRTRFGHSGGRVIAIDGVPPLALDPAPDRLTPPAGGG
jgi:hypothetical protein